MHWVIIGTCVVALILTLSGFTIGVRHKLQQQDEQMVEEFIRLFPGKCFICSFHRFGYDHGLTRDPHPAPHICIEQKEAQ